MKAIHNNGGDCFLCRIVVYANAKILNWKQFTTITNWPSEFFGCLCKCKDTKLKAIHNERLLYNNNQYVVYANAKILNWKQFTTVECEMARDNKLFMQMQRY